MKMHNRVMQSRGRDHRRADDDEYSYEEHRNNDKLDGDLDYQYTRSAREFYSDPPRDSRRSRRERSPDEYDREYYGDDGRRYRDRDYDRDYSQDDAAQYDNRESDEYDDYKSDDHIRDNREDDGHDRIRDDRGDDGHDRIRDDRGDDGPSRHRSRKDGAPKRKEKKKKFDGYNPPSASSAVVETVFRKPKVYADLHEYDGVQVIDRVPTAVGYHSMDSAEEIEEAKSRGGYSMDERKEERETEEPAQDPPEWENLETEDKTEIEIEISDDDDDKYSQYMRNHNPSMKSNMSIMSNDSDSCPPIWRSFSEEKEERNHEWALQEAKRVRALNSVEIPERANVTDIVSELNARSEEAREMNVTNDNRSRKSYHSNLSKEQSEVDVIKKKGLRRWFSGAAKSSKRGGGYVKTSDVKSSDVKNRSSNRSRSSNNDVKSRSSNRSRSSNESRGTKSKQSRSEQSRRSGRDSSHGEKSRSSGRKQVEPAPAAASDHRKNNRVVEAPKQKKAQNPSVESRSTAPSKKKEDAPRLLQKELYEPEESSARSGSKNSSSKLSEKDPYAVVEDANDDLIMKVRGQPAGSQKTKGEQQQEEGSAKEAENEGFFSYITSGLNNLANIGFKEPLSAFDFSDEERKIARLENASKTRNENENLRTEQEDEEGSIILEIQKEEEEDVARGGKRDTNERRYHDEKAGQEDRGSRSRTSRNSREKRSHGGGDEGDGSRHTMEVKSLQLDGEAEQKRTTVAVPTRLPDRETALADNIDGLPLVSIEIPSLLVPSNDDDDCSLSILGLEKKRRGRHPSKHYSEGPEPRMVTKQGKSSFIGKFLRGKKA